MCQFLSALFLLYAHLYVKLWHKIAWKVHVCAMACEVNDSVQIEKKKNHEPFPSAKVCGQRSCLAYAEVTQNFNEGTNTLYCLQWQQQPWLPGAKTHTHTRTLVRWHHFCWSVRCVHLSGATARILPVTMTQVKFKMENGSLSSCWPAAQATEVLARKIRALMSGGKSLLKQMTSHNASISAYLRQYKR